MKIRKNIFFLGGGGSEGVGLGGGQGGSERRIEVFVKIQKKKNWRGGSGGGCRVGGVRVDVIEELKFLGKFTKKNWGGGGRGEGLGRGVGLVGGQGGCERRIEVFVKNSKNNFFFFFFFGGGGSTIIFEVFGKIHTKKNGGVGGRGWVGGSGWGGGVRVDVNEELTFLGKFTKKNSGGWGSVWWGVRWGVGLVGGVRVDMNAMLG